MKSILISIKPEWVAMILNGEKTIETEEYDFRERELCSKSKASQFACE